MKKPCFMCALKAATIITAKISAADKGVTNLEARKTPPPVSASAASEA